MDHDIQVDFDMELFDRALLASRLMEFYSQVITSRQSVFDALIEMDAEVLRADLEHATIHAM